MFNDNGTVTLLMKEYLKEAIADSGMDASTVAATPAKRDLFAINKKFEHLEKKKGELFHSIVANLLYVSKRAREPGLTCSSPLLSFVPGFHAARNKTGTGYSGFYST